MLSLCAHKVGAQAVHTGSDPEVEKPDCVATNDLFECLGADHGGDAFDDLLRVRVAAVAVGVVGFEQDVVHADVIEELHAHGILKEGGVDVASEI